MRLLLRQTGAVPSTKAVGGGISVVCLTRRSRYHSKRRSWLVPLLPTFILSCLLASWTNVEDFVDAKCRCNLVNWESIAGSPLQIIPTWNNLQNIIWLWLKLGLPDKGETLDALDVVQGTAVDKVVGMGRGTRWSPKQGQGSGRGMGYTSKPKTFKLSTIKDLSNGAMVMIIAAGQGAMPWIRLLK